MVEYEMRAIAYQEKYGITDATVIGNKLMYYASYPQYLQEKHRTYKVIVNLDTMVETRTELKRYNKCGERNMYK